MAACARDATPACSHGIPAIQWAGDTATNHSVPSMQTKTCPTTACSQRVIADEQCQVAQALLGCGAAGARRGALCRGGGGGAVS